MLALKTFLIRSTLALGSMLCTSAPWAHSGHDDPAVENSVDKAITISGTEEVRPWTHLSFNDNPDAFQFAIVTDRTGGMREGVFSQAVDKLNLLQPEFVVSVGDLIEGYTEDRGQLTREWDDFDTMVKRLDMPFFYLAGNHDYTNEVMAEVWQERYGPSYYHFTYRDILFVMLNSNDGGEPHRISGEQIDWLERVLKDNPDPRWTLVFTHSPLWDRDDQDRWAEVDEMLGERRYTVFAGHHHRYVKDRRQGREYFTLATTGGVSSMRGPRFGEFDHVVWVTMSDEGPIIANLMLDGIWDSEVRTSAMRDNQDQMIDGGRIAAPALLYRNRFRRGEATLRLTNDADIPYEFKASLQPLGPIVLNGEADISTTVPPNEVRHLAVPIASREELSDFRNAVNVDWTLSYQLNGETIEYRDAIALPLVRERPIVHRPDIKLDGKLDDWREKDFIDNADHAYFNLENWSGDEDVSFAWSLATTEEHLVLAIRVTDDSLVSEAGESLSAQDLAAFYLDARPKTRRLMRQSYHSRVPGDRAFFLRPGTPEDPADLQGQPDLPEGIQYKTALTDRGYTAEVAIPHSLLDEDQGMVWEGVRLNVVIRDADQDETGRVGREWLPHWGSRSAIGGSGSFYRKR